MIHSQKHTFTKEFIALHGVEFAVRETALTLVRNLPYEELERVFNISKVNMPESFDDAGLNRGQLISLTEREMVLIKVSVEL